MFYSGKWVIIYDFETAWYHDMVLNIEHYTYKFKNSCENSIWLYIC